MTIRPLRVVAAAVDSEIRELRDLLGSASLVSGNGPSHGFLSRGVTRRIAADTAASIRRDIIAWLRGLTSALSVAIDHTRQTDPKARSALSS
jgi:hypothetical protein